MHFRTIFLLIFLDCNRRGTDLCWLEHPLWSDETQHPSDRTQNLLCLVSQSENKNPPRLQIFLGLSHNPFKSLLIRKRREYPVTRLFWSDSLQDLRRVRHSTRTASKGFRPRYIFTTKYLHLFDKLLDGFPENLLEFPWGIFSWKSEELTL